MKLAFFSPLPPIRSGNADYSRDLLPYLGEVAEVVIFSDQPAIVPKLRDKFEIAPLASYAQRRWEFDMPLYQMGNCAVHAEMYPLMRRFPGVVVLHDYVFHHFLATQNYAQELGYALGEKGRDIWFGRTPAEPFQNPLNQRIFDLALGIITHCYYIEELIRPNYPTTPLQMIPLIMPFKPQPPLDATPKNTPIVFGSIGQATPSKQLPMIFRCFSKLCEQHPNARYLIVGETVGIDIPAMIAQLPPHARKNVEWHDYVEDFEAFKALIASVDISINLRYPTVGETSSAALRALLQGKPIVAFDHGWWRELPDTVTYKIPVMDETALLTTMLQAIETYHTKILATREYVETVHAPQPIAQQYVNFIQQVIDQY